MFWIALGVMSFAAVVFTIWPLLRSQARHTPLMAVAILFVVASSAGLYASIGSPGVDGGHPETAGGEMADAVKSLARRLEANPSDIGGWRMLGRSYMTLGNYPEAIKAYERVSGKSIPYEIGPRRPGDQAKVHFVLTCCNGLE